MISRNRRFFQFLAFLVGYYLQICQSKVTLMEGAMVSGTNDTSLTTIINGIYEPGSFSTPGNCTTATATGGPYAEVFIPLSNSEPGFPNVQVQTVYIMGSQYQGQLNNTQDLQITVVNVANQYQRCIDTVDGSGYYHCGFTGHGLLLSKFGHGAQFTLCHVDVFSESNLMLSSPSVSSTTLTNAVNLPITNLLRTHPIGYTQNAAGDSYSTAMFQSTATKQASVTFSFGSEYRIKYVVVDTSQDSGKESEGQNYFVSVVTANGVSQVCSCDNCVYPTYGTYEKHETFNCTDSNNPTGFNGSQVVISKASGILTIHSVAILASECFSCTQQQIIQQNMLQSDWGPDMYITIPMELSQGYTFQLNPLICPNLAANCSAYAVTNTLSSTNDFGLTESTTDHVTTIIANSTGLNVADTSEYFLYNDDWWVYYDWAQDYPCVGISDLTFTPIAATQVYILNSGPLLIPLNYTTSPMDCVDEAVEMNYAVTPATSAIQDSVSVYLDSYGFEINVDYLNPYDAAEESVWLEEAGSESVINITATMFGFTSSMTFQLRIVDCTPDISWLNETSPLHIGLFDTKTISFDPSNAPVDCSGYTFSISIYGMPSFVSFTSGNDYVVASPTSTLDVYQTFDLQVYIEYDNNTLVEVDELFTIYVDECQLQSATLQTNFSAVTYTLDDVAKTINIPQITQIPACGYKVSQITFSDYQNIMSFKLDPLTDDPQIEISGVLNDVTPGSKNITLTIEMEDASATKVHTDQGVAPVIEVTIQDCFPVIGWLNETFPLNLTQMSGIHSVTQSTMPAECQTICPLCQVFVTTTASDDWVTVDQALGIVSFDLSAGQHPALGQYTYPWGIYDPSTTQYYTSTTDLTVNVEACVLQSLTVTPISSASYVLGESAKYLPITVPIQVPNCGYNVYSSSLSHFSDLIQLDMMNDQIIISGSSTQDPLTTTTVAVTLIMDDAVYTNFTFDFISQMDVYDCTPDFSWLNTTNGTSYALMSQSEITIAIDQVPAYCSSLENWILTFPNGNPHQGQLTAPLVDAASFTMDLTAQVPTGTYSVDLRIAHKDFSTIEYTDVFALEVLPCVLTSVEVPVASQITPPGEFVFGTTSITFPSVTIAQTPACEYNVQDVVFSSFDDILDFNTTTNTLTMGGSSTSTGTGTYTVSADLTLDDGGQTWQVSFFTTSLTIIDCTPDITWLDTANGTSISVLHPSRPLTVSIDPAAIPTECDTVDNWVMDLPYTTCTDTNVAADGTVLGDVDGDECSWYQPSWCGGNYDTAEFSSDDMCCICGGGQIQPYPDFLYAAQDGTSIFFDPNDANMLVQDYSFDLRIIHASYSSINSVLSDYTITVTPCLQQSVTWDSAHLIQPQTFMLGQTDILYQLPVQTETPACGYQITSVAFSGFNDLLSYSTSTGEIVMSGSSDPDGAISQRITADITFGDPLSTTYSNIDLFASQVKVVDCFPSLNWLDTQNMTTISVLDDAGSVDVMIDASQIPSDCPGLSEWVMSPTTQNLYPDYLTFSSGGDLFSLDISDSAMTPMVYGIKMTIAHQTYSNIKVDGTFAIEVTPCVLQNIILAQDSIFTSDFAYIVGEGIKAWEFEVNEITQEPQCQYGMSLQFEPIMATGSTSYEFQTNDINSVGQELFKVVVLWNDTAGIAQSMTIDLHIDVFAVKFNSPSNVAATQDATQISFDYTVGEQAIALDLWSMIQVSSGQNTATFNQSVSLTDQSTQALPAFITVDSPGTATIESSSEADVGEHILILEFAIGNDTAYPSFATQQLKLTVLTGVVEVQNDITSLTTPLLFAEPLTTYFNITYEEYWEYYLPAVAEDETSEVEQDIEITVSLSSDIISYEEGSQRFFLSRAATEDDIRIYSIGVDLEDKASNRTADFSIQLEIANITVEEEAVESETSDNSTNTDEGNSTAQQTEVASGSTQSTTDSGIIVTENQFVPTFDTSTLSFKEKRKLQKPLEAFISKISKQGIIDIGFSNYMVVPPDYKKLFNGESGRVQGSFVRQLSRSLQDESNIIQLDIMPGNDEIDYDEFNYSWAVTQYEPLNMKISLFFNDSSIISSTQIMDRVQIIFTPNALFQDTVGRTFGKTIVVNRAIPPQIQLSEAQVAATAEAASEGLQAVTVGNIALNFLLSASLNYLWSMIEAQQIIVMLPQFNVTIPALPNTFVTEFISIANFDVIEMDMVTEFIGLDQPEVPPFNDRLDTVGFGDTYFIHNCGALFLIILLLFLLWLFVLCCSKKNLCGFKAKRHRIQRWLNIRAVRLEGMMFWNLPIQIVLESYLILIFASLCNMIRPTTETGGQIFQLSLAYIFLGVCLLFLILSVKFMHDEHDNLHLLYYRRKYGPLYEELDLRPDKKLSIIAFRSCFLLRRIVVIMALLMTTQLWLQIILAFAQEMVVIFVLGWMQPYETKSKWKRELLNEYFIILTIYHVMCFTEGNPISTRISVGYSFCFFLSIHVFGNIFLILGMSLKSALWGLKKYMHVRKDSKRNRKIKLEMQERRLVMIKSYLAQRGDGNVSLKILDHHDMDGTYAMQRNDKMKGMVGLGLLSKINQGLGGGTGKQADRNVMYDSMEGWEPNPVQANLDKRVKRREIRLDRLKMLMKWDGQGTPEPSTENGPNSNKNGGLKRLNDLSLLQGIPVAVLKFKLQDKEFNAQFRQGLSQAELQQLDSFLDGQAKKGILVKQVSFVSQIKQSEPSTQRDKKAPRKSKMVVKIQNGKRIEMEVEASSSSSDSSSDEFYPEIESEQQATTFAPQGSLQSQSIKGLMKNTDSSFQISGAKKNLEKTRDCGHSRQSSSELIADLESLVDIGPTNQEKPLWPHEQQEFMNMSGDKSRQLDTSRILNDVEVMLEDMRANGKTKIEEDLGGEMRFETDSSVETNRNHLNAHRQNNPGNMGQKTFSEGLRGNPKVLKKRGQILKYASEQRNMEMQLPEVKRDKDLPERH